MNPATTITSRSLGTEPGIELALCGQAKSLLRPILLLASGLLTDKCSLPELLRLLP